MADSVRAIGWKPQTAIGTPATGVLASNFVEGFDWKPNIGSKKPAYKTGSRLQQTRVRRTNRHETIDLKTAGADLYEFADLLQSALGPPVSGVYKLGAALNSTPLAFLTTKMMMGLNESWLFQDGRVNTFDLQGDAANGTLDYNAQILSLIAASQPGAVWAPTRRTIPANDEPFDPWQFVVLKGGTSPGCVLNFKLHVDNHFNPLYCFPATVPTGATLPGLTPSRFTDGPPEATIMMTIEYTGYSGSAFSDFLSHVHGPWTLTMQAPLGATPGSLVWTLPDMDWEQGALDGTQAESRFVGTAALLLDPASATSLQAAITLPT